MFSLIYASTQYLLVPVSTGPSMTCKDHWVNTGAITALINLIPTGVAIVSCALNDGPTHTPSCYPADRANNNCPTNCLTEMEPAVYASLGISALNFISNGIPLLMGECEAKHWPRHGTKMVSTAAGITCMTVSVLSDKEKMSTYYLLIAGACCQVLTTLMEMIHRCCCYSLGTDWDEVENGD